MENREFGSEDLSRERVVRGAEFYALHLGAQWGEQVDWAKLNIDSPCQCVIGQLFDVFDGPTEECELLLHGTRIGPSTQDFMKRAKWLFNRIGTTVPSFVEIGCASDNPDDDGSGDDDEPSYGLLTRVWQEYAVEQGWLARVPFEGTDLW